MTSDSPVPATAGRPSLLILGASVRAAAQSALRAGFDPTCADRYADSDLRACARVLPVADFPAGLWHALRNTASVPWIYTGSLENHPALLQRIARDHPLLGTPAEVVRAVRDPVRLNRALVAAGLPALSVRLGVEPVPPADSTWMLKPRRGAAGRGVAVWNAQARGHLTLAEPHYFQRRATGTEHSALFLAGPLSTELLGTSRQLVGLDWAGAPSAAWCGNLVPDVLTGTTLEMVAAIGWAVAAAFPLRGLFGCDFIMADGVPWLTEVNPRYTGSTELLEFHRQTSLLSQHLRACRVMAG
ncbi:MAG: ATP-grasp domain-containing protein, partial [Planctomycetaceae bacterium]